MSHIAAVSVEIKDLECLRLAAEDCGLEFREDQKTFKWYGVWVDDYGAEDAAYKLLGINPNDYGKCEHALAVKGNKQAYEIGIVRRPDGKGWTVLWDFFAGGQGLMKHVSGENKNGVGKLLQRYATQVAKKAAKKAGYSVIEKMVDGVVRLEARKNG